MNDVYNADIKRCLKNSLAKQNFFDFRLTPNPGIPEYREMAFCLRIPTLDCNPAISAAYSGLPVLRGAANWDGTHCKLLQRGHRGE
jgi:hypothetical protein